MMAVLCVIYGQTLFQVGMQLHYITGPGCETIGIGFADLLDLTSNNISMKSTKLTIITDALIIDKVSMVSANVFSQLDDIIMS